MAKDPIVVVGGGRAAASLIDAYRENDGDALIVLLSADDQPPYNRPPLSKGVLRGEMEPDGALVHPAEEYDALVVELRLGTTVESIETANHTIRTEGGEEIRYGTLVIATGARPLSLPVPGADLPAVHVFRTIADAVSVKEQAADARKALVVGGSFIGSEVAASLSMLGLDVTVVEMGDRLVPALASAELSRQVAELFREHGVEVVLDEQIEEFQANGLMLTGARTVSGRLIEAFLAVVGVGVGPNVDFLDGGEIELDNGIVVDDHFRTSVDDVYAIGDVAQFDEVVFGRSRRIEHWSNADAQGRGSAAISRAGERATRKCPRSSRRCSICSCNCSAIPREPTRSCSAGRSPTATCSASISATSGSSAAVLVGQAGDMAEELTSLLGGQPRVSDRSRLANENIRPAAVFGD